MLIKKYGHKDLPFSYRTEKGGAYDNAHNCYIYRPIKAIIGLTGHSNVGKTSVLHALIDTICPNAIMSNPKDVRVLLLYKGLKIAVCSFGDSREDVEENCRLFEHIQPDICISAVNIKDGPMQAFDYYCEKMKDCCFLQIKISKNEFNERNKGDQSEEQLNQVNNKLANEIKKLIDQII